MPDNITSTIAQVAGIPATDLENVPTVPPMLATLVHDYSQKALTAISVGLMTHGLVSLSNQSDLIQFGVGAAGFVLSCVWTLGVAYLREKKMITLLNFIPGNK